MKRVNPFDKIYDSMVRKDTKWLFENPLDFPQELHVELTNKCNLKCHFCPVGCREIKRPLGYMREDLWWAICTEAQEYGAAIRFIRWGEPTLHVRCFDYIKMATSVGIPVHMNTNGVKLDVKQVLDSGLDSIKVSMHSWAAAKSVRKLVQARGDAEKPYITVATLGGEHMGNLTADRFTHSAIKDLKRGDRAPKQCYELHNRLSIDWDGTVVACCGAYDRQMRLGHIYDEETLKEIWDGNHLRRYREMEQKGQLGSVPLCQHCARSFS